MIRIQSAMIALILLAAGNVLFASSDFREPYLEVPTPTSVWINWKTDYAGSSKLEYGISETNLDQSVTPDNNQWTDAGYNNDYYYHCAHLTNLSPNTKYYYKVTTGDKASEVYSFKTFPGPGQASQTGGIIRFAIIGDNQLKNEARYDTIITKFKSNVELKYGKPFNNYIDAVLMVGDQVDIGTLDNYEWVHFDKTKYISPNIGISTVLGNHETYGTLKNQLYADHFHYDGLEYQGIKSNSEEYYAYQLGNALIINLSTEGNSDYNKVQLAWLQQVVNAANKDNTVSHIFSLGHRPYQAEQYVGDISGWIRNTAYPVLAASPKMFMHIGAHHHLYSRGQDKNLPIYNIISGGTAWDQYWGMSKEEDFDDVQKTIPRWAYQIVEINTDKKEITVECYSVGYTTKINDWTDTKDKYVWEDNILIDKFTRKFSDITPPSTPEISTVVQDTIELPITFQSSEYKTDSDELYNSTQFQVSQDISFSITEIDLLRDYENLFGMGENPWDTKDINANVDIFKLEIPKGKIGNGRHYVRVRHRDRNLTWSEWSEAQAFDVKNSIIIDPAMVVNSNYFQIGDTIKVSYTGCSGNPKDWIGIYKSGVAPGDEPSVVWAYLTGASGVANFTLEENGKYYIALMADDGYEEITDRVEITVGKKAILEATKQNYSEGEKIVLNYNNCPVNANDWIGVYKIGKTPGNISSDKWSYITQEAGSVEFDALAKGYYFAQYFLLDGYDAASEKIFFSVGDTIASVNTDKLEYNLGDLISVNFTDGPGIAKDYLGMYKKDDDPNKDPLLSYVYVNGEPSGTAVFKDNNLPKEKGEYFVVFFTNDSYNEISNRAYFEISTEVSVIEKDDDFVKLYPNPSSEDVSFIQSNYPIESLEIFDVNGRLLYSKQVNNTTNSSAILNHNLPAGVYFVKVHTDKIYTVKLVVTE